MSRDDYIKRIIDAVANKAGDSAGNGGGNLLEVALDELKKFSDSRAKNDTEDYKSRLKEQYAIELRKIEEKLMTHLKGSDDHETLAKTISFLTEQIALAKAMARLARR